MSQSFLKGFTLVEILATITIVSILSVVIIPRLSLFPSSLNESKLNLISSLMTARQIAMFSASQDSHIQFTLNNNIISIRRDNEDIKHFGIHYPNRLNKNIKHTPETLVLDFNNLGETQKFNITLSLNNISESVAVYSTGYIR